MGRLQHPNEHLSEATFSQKLIFDNYTCQNVHSAEYTFFEKFSKIYTCYKVHLAKCTFWQV